MPQVPAAAHTLAILNLLIHAEQPVSATRISAELDIPRSTTYHLLKEMVRAGFVMHLENESRYGLGVAAYAMSQAYSTQQPLVRASAQHAQRLAERVSGSAHVSKLSGMDVSYVLEERAAHAPSLITDVGVRLDALRTASGRAMLAYLPEAELHGRLHAHGYRTHEHHGEFAREEHGDYHALDTLLATIRTRGYAEEYEEITPGQQSIAAAILDHTGRPAGALTVTFPTHSLDDAHTTVICADIMRRAKHISTRMFGTANAPEPSHL